MHKNEYCGKSLILSHQIYDSKCPILHENTSVDRSVIALNYEVDGRHIVFLNMLITIICAFDISCSSLLIHFWSYDNVVADMDVVILIWSK